MTASASFSVWVATGIGGAPRSPERFAWSIAVSVWFLPTFNSTWMGNIDTVVGLAVVLVALGGSISGFAAAFATLLKVVPGTLLPVALVADRRARAHAIASLAIMGGLSVLLAPEAWLEYPTVLIHLAMGSTEVAWNLAPAAIAERAGLASPLVIAVRTAMLLLAAAAVAAATWLARKPTGLPLSALLATVAMLLLPASAWIHYAAVVFRSQRWLGLARPSGHGRCC